jgi:hypothetical protein
MSRRTGGQAGSHSSTRLFSGSVIDVQTQAIAVPRIQGHRIGGPHEIPPDPKDAPHDVVLPGRAAGVSRARSLK